VSVLAITVAPTASGKALVTAIAAIFFCAVFGYQAASNEITGKAIYHKLVVRGSLPEPVTREASPAKFREATNLLWGLSIFCAFVSVGGFTFLHISESD